MVDNDHQQQEQQQQQQQQQQCGQSGIKLMCVLNNLVRHLGARMSFDSDSGKRPLLRSERH
jgi:hypothetical protein